MLKIMGYIKDCALNLDAFTTELSQLVSDLEKKWKTN